MPRSCPRLVIDARPRGPGGPLATEDVLGRTVLVHLLEASRGLTDAPVAIHARLDDHGQMGEAVPESDRARCLLATGPPPEGAFVLRADRLYDARRLARAVRRGRDPEAGGLWRLGRPGAPAA